MRWYMHRMSRGFVAAGIVATPLVAASAASAWTEPDSVTVAFVGTSAGQGRCTARPEPAEVSLRPGAELVVVNRTESYGLLVVGERQVELLAVDESSSVDLREGQHTIRLWPVCIHPSAEPLTVLVEATASPSTSPPSQAPGSPAPGGRPEPPNQTISDPSRDSRANPSVAPPGPTASPDLTPLPSNAATSPSGTPLIDDTPVPLGGETAAGPPPSNGKARRLLALIAGICVLGVTSGLIRAIVTQRTSRSSTMIST